MNIFRTTFKFLNSGIHSFIEQKLQKLCNNFCNTHIFFLKKIFFYKNVKKTFKLKIEIDFKFFILFKYYDLLDVFFKKEVDKLFSYHTYNYKIKLKNGIQLKYFKTYHTNVKKNKEVKKYLKENFKKK